MKLQLTRQRCNYTFLYRSPFPMQKTQTRAQIHTHEFMQRNMANAAKQHSILCKN